MDNSKIGWSVCIRRKDGSEFLCASDHGDKPPVWANCNRKYAVAHKRVLKEAGFNARVVKVSYTDPVVVPNEPLAGQADKDCSAERVVDTLTPIRGCSFQDKDDGTCSHPDNFTPECHAVACPRLQNINAKMGGREDNERSPDRLVENKGGH